MRPRLLYLAYYFPPAPAIASVRTWNTANHLDRLGWDVQVVTPDPDLWLNSENPEEVKRAMAKAGFTRIVTGHDWRMLMPGQIQTSRNRLAWFVGGVCRKLANSLHIESQYGWTAAAERACASLQPGSVDCILASGNPYIAFRLARRLARRLHCPFVLDYRDPWNGDPHTSHPGHAQDIREERQLLKDCLAVTVVSPSWAKLLDVLYGVGTKTHIISNGFDPASFAGVEAKDFDHFAVVYAGTLYPPKRILDPVLIAVGACQAITSQKMRFHYYGPFSDQVWEAAERLGVSDLVETHGNVSRTEALAAQKGAGVAVVVASVEDQGTLADNGIVTGKIFDCLALGRPALVIAPEGSDIYGVAEVTGGMRCFRGSDSAGIVDYLLDCARGESPPPLRPEQYQWAHLGAKLDRLLRSLLPGEDTGTVQECQSA